MIDKNYTDDVPQHRKGLQYPDSILLIAAAVCKIKPIYDI